MLYFPAKKFPLEAVSEDGVFATNRTLKRRSG
jgi:hypothetical protein